MFEFLHTTSPALTHIILLAVVLLVVFIRSAANR